MPNDQLKTLWMQRLPTTMQALLAVSGDNWALGQSSIGQSSNAGYKK